MLIHGYGGGVPYMDEWDGIGLALFTHRADHTLRAADFLVPHNEHRVVLTRLIAYVLASANGQWDPLLEMTANAALHAGFCVALLVFARRFVRGVRFTAAALALTALFSLAFDWENTIEGFQSQFALLDWCAFGMFWLCLTAPPLSKRWFCGFAVGIAGLGSMSSGFVAAPAALGVMVLGAAFRRRWSWRESAAGGLLAAICVTGLLLYTQVPGNDRFKAGSPGEWLKALATALAWPTCRWPAALLILQLPTAIFIAGRLRARRLEGHEAVLVALAGWSWLQVGAIAYGRANFGLVTSPRYSDLYAMQSVVAILALAALWRGRSAGGGAAWTALALGWASLFVAGLWLDSRQSYAEFLDRMPGIQEAQRRHVRAFLATGDLAALKAVPDWELPYPSADTLATALEHPGIRALLPVDIRPPLTLTPEADSSGFARGTPDRLPAGVEGEVWIAREGPARLVSEPLNTGDLPFLHLEFCGSGDLDSSAISLESPQGSEAGPALPVGEDHWRSADIPVPAGLPVRLVVEIPAGKHWFAFTPPVEIGRESSSVRWLLRRSRGFATAAGAAFGAALLALLMVDRCESQRRPPAPAVST